MKVACLLGSPRSKGNTAFLAGKVLEPLEAAGAEIHRYELNRLSYRGCQGCGACKGKQDHCVLMDDLTEALERLVEADVWVLASPIYYGDVTGQFKSAIDRTYSFLKPGFTELAEPVRFPPGKRGVLITAQGAPDENMFVDVIPRYKQFLEWFGFEKVLSVRAIGAAETGACESDEALVAEARRAGEVMLEA